MSLPRLMLCLTLLVSRLGSAQTSEEWTPYTPPPTETATPPPLVPAPTPPPSSPPPQAPQAPADEEDTPEGEVIPRNLDAERGFTGQTALRLIITPWSGAIVGMMGLVFGSIPTAIVALPFCAGVADFENEPRCAIAIATGLAVSYSVGVTMGVSFVGKLIGGKGDGMLTFLGALGGAAVGSGIGIASDSTGGLILGLALCPLLGAVVAYELSHTLMTDPGGPELQARSGFRVMPVVGATARGGIVGGLAGRF